jgi:hypothetical protein
VAAGGPPVALPIVSTALTQDGQQLVWRIIAADPFTPSSLVASGRFVCLVLGRVKPAAPLGAVCLGSHGRARRPSLDYRAPTASGLGPAHRIAATVTLEGGDEL